MLHFTDHNDFKIFELNRPYRGMAPKYEFRKTETEVSNAELSHKGNGGSLGPD